MAEFQDAGKEPGLQVWRVEKMKLKLVSPDGSFHTGDAYLVLHTIEQLVYNMHMWLGKECTVDERGALAIMATLMDSHLGGHPVQHRETQGNESNLFMGYFKRGVMYKKKGSMASGFTKVETNKSDVKRLLHLKGRRNIRVTEEDLNWSSFNVDDCFIIDLGNNLYQWNGSKSNHYERLRANVVATGIRDDERGGRGELHILQEGEEPSEVLEVLGPKPDLPNGAQSDAAVDEANKRAATLYKISDASGTMIETLVSKSSPFKQADLLLSECYLIDNNAGGRLFVWKGSAANLGERSAAMTKALSFIEEKKYPANTQIEVLPAGAESTLFKQFFSDWRDKYETTCVGTPHTCRIAKVAQIPFEASTLHQNKEMAAQHNMVDDGSGTVKIWRVESDKVEVEPSTYGHFYGGDCYLILYSYRLGCKEEHIIYIWQGLKCSQAELATSAFLATALDGEKDGKPVQVRVVQGEEPAHLASLFKEKPMMMFLGGTSRKGGQTEAASTRLFHIRRSSTGATRAVEVQPNAASLNTNDVFVLKADAGLFQWLGLGSTEEELAAAKHVADYLGGEGGKEVKEGDEPDAFWSALGGKKPYQTSKSLQNVVSSPRLFVVSNATGRLIAEEVFGELSQIDLASDDIMILDTWDQIFLWIGSEANDAEKKGAPKIAADYVSADPSGRGNIPIATIKQGAEPPTFTGWFHSWVPNLWDNILAQVH